MIRLRLDVAYDGAPFAGFARQPDQTTVQGTLEDALGRVAGRQVTTVCAGRTDRGVHARGQVVHADVDETHQRVGPALEDLDALADRLDGMVGPAVTIRRVRAVPGGFDARLSARGRRYRFEVVDAPAIDPLERPVAWHVGGMLDVAAMRHAAGLLRGEHDFASFCRRPEQGTTVRRLDLATVARAGSGRITFRFAAPAFCHQQIRSVVGCLVAVGRGRREPAWIGEVLAARDRDAAAAVAPPHGLVLDGIDYGPEAATSPAGG